MILPAGSQTNPRPTEEPGAGAWVDYVGGGYHQLPLENPDDVVYKSTAQTITGAKKFGTEDDYTTFEPDGTRRAVGAATTWNDWNLSRDFTPTDGAGVPTRAVLAGNIVKDQFAVEDALQFQSAELLRDWKEGSSIEIHIHWATGGPNDGTVRGVKWEVEYLLANPVEAGGSSTLATPVTVSQEFTIPALQPDRTHRVSTIATVATTGLKVGAMLLMRLKRIAAAGAAPAADPFLISFGVHYEADTDGSRTTFSK